MRKHMLGTIAALLAVVLVAGAQTPGSEATRAALEKVTVTRDQGVVNVEMTTKGAVSPKVERLSSPDRLVVDLPAPPRSERSACDLPGPFGPEAWRSLAQGPVRPGCSEGGAVVPKPGRIGLDDLEVTLR